jgi:hypothetical protein
VMGERGDLVAALAKDGAATRLGSGTVSRVPR